MNRKCEIKYAPLCLFLVSIVWNIEKPHLPPPLNPKNFVGFFWGFYRTQIKLITHTPLNELDLIWKKHIIFIFHESRVFSISRTIFCELFSGKQKRCILKPVTTSKLVLLENTSIDEILSEATATQSKLRSKNKNNA